MFKICSCEKKPEGYKCGFSHLRRDHRGPEIDYRLWLNQKNMRRT